MRLNKFIAQAGVCSRRKADELIENGQIKVNGQVVRELGVIVDEEKDEVFIGNRKLDLFQEKVYYALNKPEGYITSVTSAQGKSVMELVKETKERIYPVGRLDKDSCGLIILTNDGELANKLMHPSFEKEKEYLVFLDKPFTREAYLEIKKGIKIGGSLAKAVIGEEGIGRREIRMILKEGLNRQIRRMLGRVGFGVMVLKRIRIGRLKLGSLKPGQYRQITLKEIL